MRQKFIYHAPQTIWSELDPDVIICDSYTSGIDDFEYEDVDWTVTH